MYCRNCGNQIVDGGNFCTRCGASVASTYDATSGAPAPTREIKSSSSVRVPTESIGARHAQSNPASNKPKGGRGKLAAIIAAVIVVLAIVGVIAGVFISQDVQNKKEHATHSVQINITAQGFDASTGTPVPIAIDGTDFEGNAVHEKVLVGSSGNNDIQLMRGEYTVTTAGSPIAKDGTIYDVADCITKVVVEQDDSQVVADLPSMKPVPIENRTDDLVDAAKTTLVDFGYSTNDATEYVQTAKEAIASYKAEQQRIAEEQQKKAEEEKAAQEAALAEKNERISQQVTNFIYLWLDQWTFEGGQYTTFNPGNTYLNCVEPGSEAATMLPKGIDGTIDASSPYVHGNAALNVFDISIQDIEDYTATVQVKFYAAQNKVTKEMYDKMVANGGQSRVYALTFDDNYLLTKISWA